MAIRTKIGFLWKLSIVPVNLIIGFGVWIPMVLFAIPTVIVGTLLGKYERSTGWDGPCWRFTNKFLRFFETTDNGCCPDWYIAKYGPKRSLKRNIITWCAFRNVMYKFPLGLPLNYDEHRKIEWEGTAMHPTFATVDHFMRTGERKWFYRWVKYGWRVGFYGSVVVMKHKDDALRVLDLHQCWKMYPHVVATKDPAGKFTIHFTIWDSGLRSL